MFAMFRRAETWKGLASRGIVGSECFQNACSTRLEPSLAIIHDVAFGLHAGDQSHRPARHEDMILVKCPDAEHRGICVHGRRYAC